MSVSGQVLLQALQQGRETLQGVLPPEQVETLLSGLLVHRAWGDKGYFQGEDLFVMYHLLADQELASLWGEWRRLYSAAGKKVGDCLGGHSLAAVPADELISVYARFQHPRQRQRFGVYYTPVAVVDFILEHTLVPHLRQEGPERVTFIDPACGCGYFLARAYDYFRASYLEEGFPSAQIPFLILKRNLFGVDLDPWALQLAALLLLEKDREVWSRHGGLPFLNLLRTDALNKQLPGVSFLARPFTVVAGNPPHVTNYARRSQHLDQRYIDTLKPQYLFSRERTSNRYNLSMFFLERFMELLEPGGRAGIVIDGSGFQTTVYREIREEIQSRTLIRHFVSGLEVFPGVNNRQAILIWERTGGEEGTGENRICHRCGLEGEVIEIPQDSWPGVWFRPVSPAIASLLAKIEAAGCPLGELYRPKSGMNVTNRPEAGLKPFLAGEPLDHTYHKAIFSGNISPYILRWPIREQVEGRGRKRKYICYDRELARSINNYLALRGEKARVSIGKSEARFRQEKLFVRQSLAGSRTIAAAYSADPEEYCDNSVYVINTSYPQYGLLYLLAILNSSLITFYARETGILSAASSATATRLPMGSSRGRGLKDLPIPAVSRSVQEPVAALARRLVALGKEMTAAESRGNTAAAAALKAAMAEIKQQVEEAVYSLYGLNGEEVELVRSHLGVKGEEKC